MFKNYMIMFKQVDKSAILNNVFNNGRLIDYYLIKNLYENSELELINELKKYQNSDGGFGNCLEPDIRMPHSSVAASDVAIAILEEIDDFNIKEEVIVKLVRYYESVFNYDKYEFDIVPKEVNNFPRAIWWNYEAKDSFSFGNPNPEICAFLLKHKHHLTKIDIYKYLNKVLNYIRNDFDNSSMHSVLSVLAFYSNVGKYYQDIIRTVIANKINHEIDLFVEGTDDYALEPFKIELISHDFLENHQEVLYKNIKTYVDVLKKGELITPNWEWYQFEDVFDDSAKKEWESYLTYGILKVLKNLKE